MTAHEVAERYQRSLDMKNYPPQVCLLKAQQLAERFGVYWSDVQEWLTLMNDPPKEPQGSAHV